MSTTAELDAQLEALRAQLRDALARRAQLPAWKVDMPDDDRAARSALAREMNELREQMHQVGRPCPKCTSGRVRTHQESYYDMDRCDGCRYSAVARKLGD